MTRNRLALGAGVAVAVAAADQLTKAWALQALADGPIHLLWTLRLRLSFNTGIAFGLGRGLGTLLVPLALAVLVVMVVLGWVGSGGLPTTVALGLVTGGAAGNLVDRLVRHGGAVVDFVDLQWWPVFNLADAAISCGVVLLLLAGRSGAQKGRSRPR